MEWDKDQVQVKVKSAVMDILAQGPGFSLPDTAVYSLHLIMKFKGALWCPGHLFSLSIRKVATYMDMVCPVRC